MKIVCVSDTHIKYPEIPDCDMIIHAGDFSYTGTYEQTKNFLEWFRATPAKYKIFISGNHDGLAEVKPGFFMELLEAYPEIIYLQHQAIEIEGIKIFGSPYTPWFYDWYFNVRRGQDIRTLWEQIPYDTNILITHGPPANILDLTPRNENVGCEDLRQVIDNNLKQLKLHVFGHIHHSYGALKHNNALYVNASNVNERYELVNKPIVVEL